MTEEDYEKEKFNEQFLLFDRGLSKLATMSPNEIKGKGKVNWFTFYGLFFRKILKSKDLIPLEEISLRIKLIRRNLPEYRPTNRKPFLNSDLILKKFSYRMTNNKKCKSPFKLRLNKQKNIDLKKTKNIFNEVNFNRRNDKKTRTVKLSHKMKFEFLSPEKNQEKKNIEKINKKENSKIKNEKIIFTSNSPNKKRKLKFNSGNKKLNESQIQKNSNTIFKFDDMEDENDDITNERIYLGTPDDKEFSLELSQANLIKAKPSIFFDNLNKVKEILNKETVFSYQKDFTSQILKFNDLYFEPKTDNFSKDSLFKDVKKTCDLFINKFYIDSEEEKNLVDLDKFL